MYLLDANVVSELRGPRPDANVVGWVRQRRPSQVYLSVTTVFEIELGVRRVERRDPPQGQRLRRWMTEGVKAQFRGRVLGTDPAVATRAAAMRVPDPRPERDCFIAAVA